MHLRAVEIGRAVSSFPVLCGRHANTGDWALSAVASLERGQNLFVVDDEWTANYLPTSVQTYPLCLMTSSEEDRGHAVGIDETSAAISRDSGEALFDQSGNPSLYLNRTRSILEADIENDIQTHHFLGELDKLGLFKSINIHVHYDDGGIQTITDLHTIDEDRLQSLLPDQLHDLAARGYLLLMHAMLVSIHQFNSLVRKHNRIPESRRVKQVKLSVARDSAETVAAV